MSTARNDSLDICRGIAMFLVVFGHVIQCYSKTPEQYLSNRIYLMIYTFHMPLFMLISGILYKKSVTNKHASVKKSTWQLLYPYFLWGGVILAVEILINLFIGGMNDIAITITQTITSFSPYWFLLSLWMSSIIAVICYKLSSNPFIQNCLLCATALIWFLSGFRDRDGWMNIFFVIGFLLSDAYFKYLNQAKTILHQKSIIFGTLSLCGFLILCRNIGSDSILYIAGYGNFLSLTSIIRWSLFFLRACLGCITVFMCSVVISEGIDNESKICAFCCKIGKSTLVIFLIQKVLIEYIGRIVVRLMGCQYPGILLSSVFLYTFLAVILAIIYLTLIYVAGNQILKRRVLRQLLLGMFDAYPD